MRDISAPSSGISYPGVFGSSPVSPGIVEIRSKLSPEFDDIMSPRNCCSSADSPAQSKSADWCERVGRIRVHPVKEPRDPPAYQFQVHGTSGLLPRRQSLLAVRQTTVVSAVSVSRNVS